MAGAFAPEMLVIVTFAESGTGTLQVLHQAGFTDPTDRDAHERGWASALRQPVDELSRHRAVGPDDSGASLAENGQASGDPSCP